MPLDTTNIDCILFDYGNTIIEFSRRQIAMLDEALTAGLARHFAAPDPKAVATIRDRNRLAPYAGDPPEYRENDIVEITENLIRELYGCAPDPAVVADLVRARYDAFLAVLETPEYVPGILEQLRKRYRLAVVSNYPVGDAIRDGMAQSGIDRFFEIIVVSGDLGYCKPHPAPFEAALAHLGTAPERAVYVGDNWLADVQGAKRLGMQAVRTHQWTPPEPFGPQPGDYLPDAEINHFTELPRLLLNGAAK